MSVRAGSGLALLSCVVVLGGCGLDTEREPAATSASATSAETPRELPPANAAAASSPPRDSETGGETGSTYEAMCGHYCATLEKTLVYSCLLAGGEGGPCQQMWQGHAGRCFELRCLSGRADVAVCLLQCDALDRHYGPYCAVADPARQPLCPLSVEEQGRACRAGCSLSTEPPVETQAPVSRS